MKINKRIMVIGFWCGVLAGTTGCMQLTGAKKINAWGLEIESNSGFEVSAGAMQYDFSLAKKGTNTPEARESGGGSSQKKY